MKRIITFVALCAALISCRPTADRPTADAFVRIDGTDLVQPDGQKLFIRGTNLGNWLNPEGYMFGFSRTNSPHMIDLMLRQAVGPDAADEFWQRFKDSYITREDIRFIASTGANTIRLPFNYRMFTDEDYMGLKASQDGFARVDELVEWCREEGLYLILDMHDAPGGQTGDNIDDSYGYPWLFESEASQRLFCERYRDETTILGYELLNEPIAPYFDNVDQLNARLKEIYRMGVEAIREVDDNHIILLGGAQWNGNFTPLDDCNFDDKIMYTCHRYGGGRCDTFVHRLPRPHRPPHVHGRDRSQHLRVDGRILPYDAAERHRLHLLAIQEDRLVVVGGLRGSRGLAADSRVLAGPARQLRRDTRGTRRHAGHATLSGRSHRGRPLREQPYRHSLHPRHRSRRAITMTGAHACGRPFYGAAAFVHGKARILQPDA